MNALTNLAASIRREHEAAQECASKAVEHAKRAGELLIEAKAAVGHGEWLSWLAANVQLSGRTCQAYMRVARELPKLEGEKAQRVADMSLRDAMRSLSATALYMGKAADAGLSLDDIETRADKRPLSHVVSRALKEQKLAGIRSESRENLEPPDATGRALLVEVHRKSGRVRVKLGPNQAYIELRDRLAELEPGFAEFLDEVKAKRAEAEELERHASALRKEADKQEAAIRRVMAEEIKAECGPILCAESLTYQLPAESIAELEATRSQSEIAEALMSGALNAAPCARALGLDLSFWRYIDNGMQAVSGWTGVGLEAV